MLKQQTVTIHLHLSISRRNHLLIELLCQRGDFLPVFAGPSTQQNAQFN